MIDCPQYDTCAAPLCPLDLASLHGAIWYAEEAFCRRAHGGRAPWFIQNQRKIARLPEPERRGYFTYAMLDAAGKVSKGINGLDVDKRGDKDEQEAAWIAKRSRVRISEEERQRRSQRMRERQKRRRCTHESGWRGECGAEDVQGGGAEKTPVSAPFSALEEREEKVAVFRPETPIGEEGP